MANYRIEFSSTAEKVLKKIPKKDLIKIIESIQILAINPFGFATDVFVSFILW